MQKQSKTFRLLIFLGSFLLLFMGGFHGSGLRYVTEKMTSSNASDFLKDIFPILFVHPSIHMVGLAALGFLSLFLKTDGKKILWLVAVLVIIDSCLAFFLGGILPGILLALSAFAYVYAGILFQADSVE
ncbi:MAG: hypothetical protein AAGC85_19375 [Bacteroidota bacterium]